MAASATRRVEVALPPQEAEARLYEAMTAAGLTGVRGGGGRLVGSAPMSWTGWGETVSGVVGFGPAGSVVELRSESSYPLTLLDWGKNATNLARVLDELRRRAPLR